MRKSSVIIVFGAVVLAFLASFIWNTTYPNEPSDGGSRFVVHADESRDSVIQRLKSENLIRSVNLFEWRLRVYGQDTECQPGVYDLTVADGDLDIIERLAIGGLVAGATGPKGSVKVSEEGIGPYCAYGGKKIERGLDYGNDGVLDPDEVGATSYVCNGVTGAQG